MAFNVRTVPQLSCVSTVLNSTRNCMTLLILVIVSLVLTKAYALNESDRAPVLPESKVARIDFGTVHLLSEAHEANVSINRRILDSAYCYNEGSGPSISDLNGLSNYFNSISGEQVVLSPAQYTELVYGDAKLRVLNAHPYCQLVFNWRDITTITTLLYNDCLYLTGSNGRYILDGHPAVIDIYAEGGSLPPYSAESTQCDASGDVRMRDEF